MIDAIEKEKVHLSPFNLEIHVIFDSMNNDRKENSIECLIWSVLQSVDRTGTVTMLQCSGWPALCSAIS